MTTYLVTWSIDVDADNPTEAATIAAMIQRDSDSTATHFKVEDPLGTVVDVDLSEDDLMEEAQDAPPCGHPDCPVKAAHIHGPHIQKES